MQSAYKNAGHLKQAFPKRFFDEIELAAPADLKLNQTIQAETATYGTVGTAV